MTKKLNEATTHPDKVRPSSAVSRWSMDSGDVSSGVISDSWGSNDGTLNGGVTVGASGIGGGEAFSFDGSDDRIDVPSDSSFNTISEITLAAWIKTTAESSDQHIVSVGGWEPAYYFYITTGGKVNLQFGSTNGSGGYLNYSGNQVVSDGSWHHIAATYDTVSGRSQIYVDGSTDASTTHSQNSFDTSDTMGIGYQRAYDQNYFQGKIDELRVYSSALSQQQIWKLYNIGRNANWGYSRS